MRAGWWPFLMLAAVLALAAPLFAESPEFVARVHRNARGETMPYRLFIPADYDAKRAYPLVLWLHGGAGRGSDNQKQISGGNAAGATFWTRYPSFVVAPQCPAGETWTEPSRLGDVVELVQALQRTYKIDARRMYVAGQSMGGYGVWALITAYPNMFAAAVPVCGGGDEAKAARIAAVVWAFHGELDQAVSVEQSRRMVAAMRRARRDVKYTEYAGAGHVVWDRVFAEPELLPWVFAKVRR